MEFLSGMDMLVTEIANVGLTILFVVLVLVIFNWLGDKI